MGCMTATAVFALLGSATAQADSWEFEVTPYLFGAGVNGTIGVRGVTADIDASLSDILAHLDTTFMATFEARKGQWILGFDSMYIRLEGEKSKSWQGPGGIGNANGELDVTNRLQVYQPTLGYRLVNTGTKFDVFGGARYTQIDVDADLSRTSAVLPGGSRSASGRDSWWDPIVGVRVMLPFTDQWSLVGYADVGGFGVGSDFTYQVMAGVDWAFAKSFTAKAGYRYLHQDYKNDDNQFVWDASLSGVYLGLGIAF